MAEYSRIEIIYEKVFKNFYLFFFLSFLALQHLHSLLCDENDISHFYNLNYGDPGVAEGKGRQKK